MLGQRAEFYNVIRMAGEFGAVFLCDFFDCIAFAQLQSSGSNEVSRSIVIRTMKVNQASKCNHDFPRRISQLSNILETPSFRKIESLGNQSNRE